MEDTKQNDELSSKTHHDEDIQSDEPIPKADFGDLYKYLTGPYKTLFFIGWCAAFFGGKTISL